MRIIYSDEHLPVLSEHKSSIFLVGPTPRTPLVQGWRSQALDILEHLAYDGLVYHPEPRLNWPDFVQQVEWELAALEAASAIVCWVPRNMVNMPALTTNCEFGMFVKSRRLWYGRPDNAEHIRYLDYVYTKYTGRLPQTSLSGLLTTVLAEKING
jgi:hypothetical protein